MADDKMRNLEDKGLAIEEKHTRERVNIPS